MSASLNEEIQRLAFYNLRPFVFHLYVFPYLCLYAVWAYLWTIIYGLEEYFEAGLIVLAAIGLLQCLTCLCCVWSIHVRCALTCGKVKDPFKAEWVKVVPVANNGSTEMVKLHHKKADGDSPLWFHFQKTKYLYDDEERKEFVPISFPCDQSMQFYMDARGYQSDTELQAVTHKYGKNNMVMDVPKFMELFRERATAPFFVFQVFCVCLWMLDEYWYYSVFTLMMLVTFEATLVQQQLRNMTEIRKMGIPPYLIQVYRNRKWIKIMTDELVPGDIVSIVRSQEDKIVPCDLLLLRGPCIVDESMLTGESVPVMKEPCENLEKSRFLNLDQDGKLHVLFGGTKVVQHTSPSKTGAGLKAGDDGCIAYVLRHSFNTSQGKLLRTILYGVKRVTANSLETFFFIMFLLIFAIIAASYVWIEGTKDPNRNRYKLFLECTLILTSVVPPELPIELSLAVNNSLLALTKLYVYCTEPFRIPFAGKIDICCFDKTGTLTSDIMLVEGITGITGSDIISPGDAPLETTQVLATCHSLVQLDAEMVGDPLEKATLKYVDWVLTKGETVVPQKKKTHGLKIYQRFHFQSSLKRMSVIVGHTPLGSTEVDYMATVKGAPETLQAMFTSVPSYYEEVYLKMARRGARVLALGYKRLGALSHQQVREMTRDQLEKDLEFAGFVVISCPLKADSKAAMKEIIHSSHHVAMITGDNPLTACHVAKELRMTRRDGAALILTPPNDLADEWHWQSIDDKTILKAKPNNVKKDLIKAYDLCLTGEALSYLQMKDMAYFHLLLANTKVFARVAPKQKELIITSLKSKGYITLMCGDGTNDVGALKHADVGIALLTGQLLDKKKKEKEPLSDEGSSVDRASSPTNTKAPVGRPMNKAAKMRAATRGDQPGGGAMNAQQKKLATLLKEIEEEEKAQVIRLGDASIASPFTSKLSTVMSVCNIIKQGRCTLVTTLQMFKILALNSLVLAYSQSVLYLDGIKFSDGQATMQGLLLAGCFLFISRSKPLKHLSRERPLPNIFNVYTVMTVFLQFCVHFCSLLFLVREAKARMPQLEEGEFPDVEKEFEPSILNTTVYIISMSLQVSTFAVNYKGEPFMERLRDNKPLLYSLMFSTGAVITLASGAVPELCGTFELVLLPTEFRNMVLSVVVGDIAAVFAIDRTVQFLLGGGRLKSTC